MYLYLTEDRFKQSSACYPVLSAYNANNENKNGLTSVSRVKTVSVICRNKVNDNGNAIKFEMKMDVDSETGYLYMSVLTAVICCSGLSTCDYRVCNCTVTSEK